MPIDRDIKVTCDYCQKQCASEFSGDYTDGELIDVIYNKYGWIKVRDDIFCYACQLMILPIWDKDSKRWDWPSIKPLPIFPKNP